MQKVDLAAFLAEHPPFDSLGPDALGEVALEAEVEQFADGELILDAFATRTDEVFVVVAGRVHLLWSRSRPRDRGAGRGRPARRCLRLLGHVDRAVHRAARGRGRCDHGGADPGRTRPRRPSRPAAGRGSWPRRCRRPTTRAPGVPTYSVVDELIEREPLVVDARTPVGEVAEADDREGLAGRRRADRGRTVRARHRLDAAGTRPGRRPAGSARRCRRSWTRRRRWSCWATPPPGR